MAVPDWPTTYGYNLWLYPWRTWFYGPWDLFIEHGHRLFASLVGLLTIALLVVLLRAEPLRWVRGLGALALAAVIFQGVLGGMRVVQNELLLAKIHGCFGPAFFALTAALATVTSKRWRSGAAGATHEHATRLHVLAAATTLLAFLQVVLGAQLRHLPPAADHGYFRAALMLHLLGAAMLVLHTMLLTARIGRFHMTEPVLVRSGLLLLGLVSFQIALGGAAYVTNYGFPEWAVFELTSGYVVEAKGRAQVHAATAHVAVGSLILVVALRTTLLAARLVRRPPRAIAVAAIATGATA